MPVQSATSWLEVLEMAEKNVKVPEEVPALKRASSRGSRSSVWEHFSDPTAEKCTTCKHCNGSYKYTGGTTNLINHLKSSHPAFVGGNSIFKQAVKVELSDIERTVFGTKPIGTFGALHTSKACSVTRSNQIAELILDWIAGDMRPLGIANDPGFQNLLKYLEPGYSVPFRTTIS